MVKQQKSRMWVHIPSRSSTQALYLCSHSPCSPSNRTISSLVRVSETPSICGGCSKDARSAARYIQASAIVCGGYCKGANVRLLQRISATGRRKYWLKKNWTYLSTTSLHANLANFFGAFKARPILMTYGKGMRTVKLKQIVSRTRRSMPRRCWRSCSTV